MKSLTTLLGHAPGKFAGAALLGALSGVSFAGVLALANRALTGPASVTWFAGLGFVAACLFAFGASALSQVVLVRLAQGLVLELQTRVVGAILDTPLRSLERLGPARLMAALTADIESVSRAAPWMARVVVHAAILAACIAYLSWLSLPLTGILSGFIVLGGFAYALLTARGSRFVRKAQGARDRLYEHFQAALDGAKELKLYGTWRTRFFERFLEDARRFAAHRIRATTLYALTGSWGVTLFFLAVGFIVFVAPLFLELSTSLRTEFALCTLFMLTPLRSLMNGLPELAQAGVALERVRQLGLHLSREKSGGEMMAFQGFGGEDILSRQRDRLEVVSPPNASVAGDSRGAFSRLELRDVRFQFDSEGGDQGFALGPVRLDIHRGEVLFVVGGNGGGKSTLTKLITGLYPCDEGDLVWNGEVVQSRDLKNYRRLFSAVYSDYHLFDELLGSRGQPAFETQANDYLGRLQLNTKVRLEGARFSTVALSQGQRKRLALMASLLEDRPVCVFDEWAADQDPVFKELFYRDILTELRRRGKTVIAVTHDDRYFDCADRCVQLESGQILTPRFSSRETSHEHTHSVL